MSGWKLEKRPIVCVVGARPNYMKMAPIIRAFRERQPEIPVLLVHTGQHYDHAMNARLFADLNMPVPDLNLEVGSGSHAVQTAEVMKRFEPVIDTHVPSAVIVVGDVNSTLACSLVAVKKGVPVVHVEAGLRSFDRAMPEEINRILTDQISDLLFTTERQAQDHLVREGIDPARIAFVGNVMIDTLLANRLAAPSAAEILSKSGVEIERFGRPSKYGLVTLHRPSNVDQASTLSALLAALGKVAERIPLIFALHPRTRSNADRFGLGACLDHPGFTILPPQGYLEMLGLMADATLVLTDSGGIQEETTAMAVPCVTLRHNTERPITVHQGTNTVVGTDEAAILACVDDILVTGGKSGRIPELWDGHAATRIVDHIANWLKSGASAARPTSV